MPTRLEPKIVQVLREGYSRTQFNADLLSGVIVGIVALPLAIAFAIASGVKPEQGLYTAIIAGFVIALLGGSRVQVSGPTGAFIVVVAGIVQQYGYEGLAIATFIAGFMLIAMGIARMGILLRFIPYPLTIGFTSGIAVIIFSSQIKDLLGLSIEKVPADFIDKWVSYYHHLSTINFTSVLLSLLSLLVIILWPKVSRKIPGSLVAIVVGTLLVELFSLQVDTIHSRFGEVPHTLPTPHMPEISWELIKKMISPALTIALLGAIESLLSAVVADGMIGTRHRSNMELIAQGIGNILSPLFGGIPATGAIARTATNVKNGGRTPFAAIIHAVVLLLIMVCFGSLAEKIPMPVLAAILVLVAYNMSEWHTFVRMLKAPKGDVIVMILTFLLTVFVDLTVAIEVGVVLSAFLFLKSLESTTEVEILSEELHHGEEEDDNDEGAISRREVPPEVEVFELSGPLFFGAVERFKNAVQRVENPPKVYILRLRNVPVIDATGILALEDMLERITHEKGYLLLSGVKPLPRSSLERVGFTRKLGADNILPNIDDALQRARTLLQK